MTIETTDLVAASTADGSETEFTYDFKVYSADDINVYVNAAIVSTVAYTVTLNSDYVGGTVTFATAPAISSLVEIARSVELTQSTAYPVAGPFPAASHERALDRLTMIAQQQQRLIEEGLSWPPVAGVWATYTPYKKNQFVYGDDSTIYLCKIAHTSTSSFATDLADGYWELFMDVEDSVSALAAGASATAAAESATTATEAAADILALGVLAVQKYGGVDTGAAVLPSGTTAERPGTPAVGHLRYNTDISDYEIYDGTDWQILAVVDDLSDRAYAAYTVPQTASTGAATIPSGTTAERPGTPVAGQIRYNSTLGALEKYVGGAWGLVSIEIVQLDPETGPYSCNGGGNIDWSAKGYTYEDFTFIMVVGQATGLTSPKINTETTLIYVPSIATSNEHKIGLTINSGAAAFVLASVAFDTTSKTDLDLRLSGSSGDDFNVYTVHGIKI